MANTPTLITPNIGSAVASSINFGATATSKKIALFDAAGNNFEYYGFGVAPSVLKYSVNTTAANHIFYAGLTSSTEQEVFSYLTLGIQDQWQWRSLDKQHCSEPGSRPDGW